MQAIKKTILTAFALTAATAAFPASIDETLRSVEENNLELKSLRQGIEIEAMESRAANLPEGPSIEYGRLYDASGAAASSELEVMQPFEFPTIYAARSKAAGRRREAAETAYSERRQSILLEARNACLYLVYLSLADSVLTLRSGNSERLLELYEKRMANGDANAIELNKIRLDRMSAEAERVRIENERLGAAAALAALNGGSDPGFSDTAYPEPDLGGLEAAADEALGRDAATLSAKALESAAESELSVSRQGWIPSFEAGYVRETEGGAAANGFKIGASFPLYSTAGKVRAAKASLTRAGIETQRAEAEAGSRIGGLKNEIESLSRLLAAYDRELLGGTLDLLSKAVENGEISLIYYYAEAEKIYASLLECLQIELRLHQAASELNKHKL